MLLCCGPFLFRNGMKNAGLAWRTDSGRCGRGRLGGGRHGRAPAEPGRRVEKSRPVSRVLSRTIIPLGRTSPHASSSLPGSSAGHADGSLFGLAPDGVYPATRVATGAVRSYRTISPLPARPGNERNRRYIFCGTFRRLAPPRHYLAPCPVEPGLSSRPQATGRPPGRLFSGRDASPLAGPWQALIRRASPPRRLPRHLHRDAAGPRR